MPRCEPSRRQPFFLVLCFLSVLMFGILQINLKFDREKSPSNFFSGINSIEELISIGDDNVEHSIFSEIPHYYAKRFQNLVLVDIGKKGEKFNGAKFSFNNRTKLHDGHYMRENKTSNGQIQGSHKHVDSSDHNKYRKSRYPLKDIQFKQAKYRKYKAEETDSLHKLKNKVIGTILEKYGNNSLPFHPLQYPQRLDVGKLVKTFVKKGKLPSNPINKWKYSSIINPSKKCVTRQGGVFLLFIVKTRPENFVKRKVIRETWADEKRFPNMRAVFSIGIPRDSWITQKIKLESLEYGDVLLMDYIDSYNNLTLKTTSGINWAVAHCNVAEFVVSVDDDMYVATDFLLQHLKDMPPEKADRLYHGHLYHNTEPVRHGEKDAWESKWVITKKEYPFDNYPDYIFGGFVIMSMRTVLEMSVAIPYTRPINMEDVYLGIVASRLGIVATNTDLVDFYITYSNVEKFKTLIASHYYSSSHMLKKAWECHLSFVYSDVEKSVFCLYLKPELQKLRQKNADRNVY